MRFTIISLFITLTLSAFSQAQDENFYLNESKISWRKAYSTEKTKEQVFTYFENSELFEKFTIENGQIYAQLKKHAIDPKATGVAGVPKIVNDNDYKGSVVIEYRAKEKEYVISFQELVFVGKGSYFKKKEEQKFEDHFLKKGVSEYRLYFLKKPKKVYNATFDKIFIMK